jgi:3-dehydroquinate synthase
LELRHPSGMTRIAAGDGAIGGEMSAVGGWLEGRRVFVVSSPTVLRLHGELVREVVAGALEAPILVVPDGEPAKSLDQARRLWSEMLAAGGKRDSRIVAFGGGSVGDLAGFVAGCFLRGVELIQIPTTLLAQVDASVGGKTGVNMPDAKNSVGLFHHPFAVLADSRVLATLPPAELRSGLVEVIKMAALLDLDLLGRVERDLDDLLAGDPVALAPVVVAAIRAKAGVVERDPDERDERRLLNFGHTLGHGLEAALGYDGLLHGEAVAYGMLFALRLAATRGLATSDAERLKRLLGRLGLEALPQVAFETVLAAIARDKKGRETGLPWVLPARLGRGSIHQDVGQAELEAELSAFLGSPWG